MRTTKKLLLVDDSTVMRAILRRALAGADLAIGEILEASNAEETLERLSAHHDVALVLSDVDMPGLDVVDLVRAIRERATAGELPVVVLASESKRALALDAVAAGANGWIGKPPSRDAIRDGLESYCGTA